MRIIGIDPGLATTGIGFIQTEKRGSIEHVDWCTITTPPKIPVSNRLEELQKDLDEYIKETNPDLAVVEKLFFSTNNKTAIDVAQARGVILLTLQSQGIPVMEPTPLQLKSSITGDGRADKLQIQTMLVRELKLKEPPKPDDAADALALALFGIFQHAHTADATRESRLR